MFGCFFMTEQVIGHKIVKLTVPTHCGIIEGLKSMFNEIIWDAKMFRRQHMVVNVAFQNPVFVNMEKRKC